MGNCQACLSRKSVRGRTSEEEDEMIRVVRTTDNELFQFPGPVSVKDLLFGFQGFAVFPHPFTKKPQQPLPPHTLLNFRHLYYLQPSVYPSFINSNPHSNCPIQSLIKPFLDFGTYSLINHSDKDLLLAHQTSVNHGIQGDFITFNAQHNAFNEFSGDLLALKKSQEMLIAGDLTHAQEAGALNELAINYAQEESFNEHAEGLITIKAPAQDERPADHGLPDGSLTLNAHDRSLNELAEVINAQEEPSSLDVPIQSPSQIMKVKKVKFSDEIVVIPSSKAMVDSAAPTCSPISTGNTAIASNEEPIRRYGKAIGQFDEQIGYYTATKEEVMPYMSKKEMNGVVRLKVVISKKQLTELMSSRGSSDKQSSALMEKMLAPLLSPSHKSDRSFHRVSSPSWRPSLDHIPEDHDFF